MKVSTIIKYGLMLNGQLLKYSRTQNPEGCEGVSESYELDDYSDEDWLVDDELTAEYVRNYSTEWYNADYQTPINRYTTKKDEISVVKVEVTTKVETVKVKIPTMEEYLRAKYPKPESKDHLTYCLDSYKKGKLLPYTLYDLKHNIKAINQYLNRE